MYTFSLITLEDLQKIEYTSDYPGVQTTWITDWYKTFKQQDDNILGANKKAYIVTAYKGNKLVAIVPLMKLTRTYFNFFKLQFLEFLGQQWSGMGYDIIKIKKLDSCFSNDLIVWLKRNISFHFLFLKFLPETTGFATKYFLYRYAGAPFIKPMSFQDYNEFSLQVYSRKFREDLRRTLRKIKKDGYEMTIEHKEIDDESLKIIRRISSSKTNDGKSNLYANNLKEDFHLKMYQSIQSKVVFVKFNGKAVAYGTLIEFNGQRIGVDAAFDRDYRRYGVGIHCVDQVIRSCFKDGIKKLSFGLGMDTYKFQFTNCIEEFFMCYDFKIRLKALLVLPYFKFRIRKTHKEVQAVFDKFSNIDQEVKNTKEIKKPDTVLVTREKNLQHSN